MQASLSIGLGELVVEVPERGTNFNHRVKSESSNTTYWRSIYASDEQTRCSGRILRAIFCFAGKIPQLS